MNDAFFDFEWPVAPRYEWQDWLDTSGVPIVVAAHGVASLGSGSAVERAWKRLEKEQRKAGPVLAPILNDQSEQQRYFPMRREHAVLFRQFAALDYRDRAVILAFATRYGLLGLPLQRQALVVRDQSGSRRYHSAYGESQLAWAREIVQMREGLKLTEHPTSFERSRRLKSLCDRHLEDVRGRLAFDRAGQPRLAIEPMTLVAAMWLQLASAITGGKRFVACKFCRRVFEISTEQSGFRSNREFCTDACKTKDYRRRKRTALRLAESGKSATAISDRVATNKATIEKWLAASRKRGMGRK